jgi:NAD(P)-dependent dehydrogenase (short-subunit alcohol dehydrogenase family)
MSTGGWEAGDVPDLTGETVVVTGANSGVGYEATRAFTQRGATVVMACRNRERGERARRELAAGATAGTLEVRDCDLACLESVGRFARGVREDHDGVDVLCNNAGVMALPRSETDDGFETQFGVNHLGHFALTGHLLDALLESAGESRVVTQSSGLHERGTIDFDDLHGERDYGKWSAYAQSKLANLLFAYELDRRLDRAGVDDLVSVACHPGYADTNLQARTATAAGSTLTRWAMRAANAVFAQPADRGALPMLYAATAADVSGSEYVGPGGLLRLRGSPATQRSSDRSYDRETAARLWERSEALIGVRYEFGD